MPDGHTYLCRLAAAKARFDNRHSTSAPTPTLTAVSGSGARGTSSPLNRQCYPPHFMRECIPPNLHDPQRAKGSLDRRSKRLSFPHFFLRRKKCGRRRPPPRQGETDSPPQRRNPPRAKGSLNRRFEWFSLVTFFLQKKKVTRAGARNAPSRARRQCPPNTTAASAATYPLRCSAPQWARFDNRQKRPAHQPLSSHCISGSGARGTSNPLNRQRHPPCPFREISTVKFALTLPAQGSLET